MRDAVRVRALDPAHQGARAALNAGVDVELLEIARSALAAYDLPPAPQISPIRLENNAVFEVVTENATRFVLRVHRPRYRTEAHIRSELQFLRALAPELQGSPIDVPRPLVARNGDLVVRAGSRWCDLLTWIDGRVLRPGRGLGPRSTFLLGEALARLHLAARRFEPGFELPRWDAARRFECPPGFELPRWDAATMFSAASPFRPGDMDEFLSAEASALFRQVAERTGAAFEELERTPEPWGIIHADFILLNCHFAHRAGGWRLGVLDFDDLGWGYFLFDLAPLLGNLADHPGSYARLARAFLDGYRSIRPLPRELEAHLPILMAARHAVVLTWLAARQRGRLMDPPVERHVEYRVGEMRRLLAPR